MSNFQACCSAPKMEVLTSAMQGVEKCPAIMERHMSIFSGLL